GVEGCPAKKSCEQGGVRCLISHPGVSIVICLGCPKGQCFFGVSVCMEVVSLADRWRNPGGSSQDVGHFSPQVKTTEMVVRVPPRVG
ncbi:hypothetical protein BON22_4327, partial [Cyberlindnera fabianii]